MNETDTHVPVIRSSAGSFLATVDLWRRPDGQISARLIDMPPHVIEHHGADAPERLRILGDWLRSAADQIEDQATALEPAR